MNNYLAHYILEQKTTGMLVPSGDGLADLIIKQADLSEKKSVVELGTGTGVITKKIVEAISPETIFFALEINDYFARATREKCPGAEVYNDSAENIKNYLIRHKLKLCDCVISSLPWANFNFSLQKKIMLSISQSLSEGGIFITYAYLQGLILPSGRSLKNLLKENFLTVSKSKIVWKNFPPAIVYCAKK